MAVPSEVVELKHRTIQKVSSGDKKIARIEALYDASEFEAALRALSAIRVSKRNSATLLGLAGSCYFNLGNLNLAEYCYLQVLKQTPDCLMTLGNLRMLYKARGQTQEAIHCLERIITLAPRDLPAHLDLAILFRLERQFRKAEHYARQALAISPCSDEAFFMLGLILEDTNNFAEAESAYRMALTLNPGDAHKAGCLGLLLMSLNRWEEGLPLYEARHRAFLESRQFLDTEPGPNVSFPQWNREDLANKSLLIWPEQGFGDQIQLVRYIQRLRAIGATRITLVCEQPLRTLFSRIEGVDAVLTREMFYSAGAPAHDFWTFIFSIPLNLGERVATIPNQIPYLRSTKQAEEKWRPFLGGSSSKKVGLVWKGGPRNASDATRSLPGLGTLHPLWRVPGFEFVSLQKHCTEAQIAQEAEGRPILCLGDKTTDFADTAAIIAQLDLVITVDTAVAHLSAALGKKTWVLIPNVAVDWRWGRSGRDSVWYPGVLRLFRQPPHAADWTSTVEEVVQGLSALN